MATIAFYRSFLVLSLVCVVSFGAEIKVKEFNELRHDAFEDGPVRYPHELFEKKIHSMIRLIESGDIPEEVQGNQTYEYLMSLVNDCKDIECNLDEDLQKFERLGKRKPGAPYLNRYLEFCQYRLERRCGPHVYERVSTKLDLVDEGSMKAVELLASQTYSDLQKQLRLNISFRNNPGAPNHITVLRALAHLNPASSKKILKKWRIKKVALAEFMNEIRQPCIKFLQHVDPIVKLSFANYWTFVTGAGLVGKWHYYLNTCQKVVENWDRILESAKRSYREHLSEALN